MSSYSLIVNGTTYNVNVTDPSTPLLWVLRDVIGLTGTKYGCGIQVCGACTVLLDGSAERACDVDIKEAAGRKITTIEGLSPNRSHPLQQAWIAQQVPQCGYCQSGMLMAASEMVHSNSNPSDASISNIGNVCVCGTYQRVRAAIHQAAASVKSTGGGGGGTGGGSGTRSGGSGSNGGDN